jgi:transcriptional regulator with XRE-family HTH domain
MENKAISQDYSFTTMSHSQIIKVMEALRKAKRISKHELSKMAGYSRTVYSRISNSSYRFSHTSYGRFLDAIHGKPLKPRKKIQIEYSQDIKVDFSKITLEEAIAICKANGLRVAKSEVTTNWIEL